MDQPESLTRPREVRAYLQELEFNPSKSLGQNFLIDPHVRDQIVDAAGVGAEDKVIEVGPGLGVMTEALLNKGAQVLAIELDHRLVRHLEQRLSGREGLVIRQGDATETDWAAECRPDPVRVVSNLPYSVGSRVLYDLADPRWAPVSITVMVQSDVADRLIARAGDGNYGLLSVRMSWMFTIRRVRNVPGSCFLPPPRVGSSVVQLDRHDRPTVVLNDPAHFERLVKFAFTRRRKQLGTILRQFDASINDEAAEFLTRRPETLSPTDWAELSNRLC